MFMGKLVHILNVVPMRTRLPLPHAPQLGRAEATGGRYPARAQAQVVEGEEGRGHVPGNTPPHIGVPSFGSCL